MPYSGYPTPDMPGTVTQTTRCITVPDIPEFVALIGGLLFQATRRGFWIETGSMTAQEAADLMADALALYDAEEVCNVDTTPVGNMMTIPHDTVPDKWLLCHGTTVYNRVDYPELYALLTNFHIDADTFNLPNMASRMPLGFLSSGEPVGTAGGSGQVTLNITNIPPHTHTQQGRVGGGALARNVADNAGTTTTANIQETASAGGSAGVVQPFAIMNPYLRMKYIIKALP